MCHLCINEVIIIQYLTGFRPNLAQVGVLFNGKHLEKKKKRDRNLIFLLNDRSMVVLYLILIYFEVLIGSLDWEF